MQQPAQLGALVTTAIPRRRRQEFGPPALLPSAASTRLPASQPALAGPPSELENHLGLADKTLSEFIIELSKGKGSVKEFRLELRENGADMPDALVDTLWAIIQKMMPGRAGGGGSGSGGGARGGPTLKSSFLPSVATLPPVVRRAPANATSKSTSP